MSKTLYKIFMDHYTIELNASFISLEVIVHFMNSVFTLFPRGLHTIGMA